MGIKVSLFASAVRPIMWDSFFKSLEGTTVEYEVIFAGHCTEKEIEIFKNIPNFKYIHTARIKPAQCYEIARRACVGEVVLWVADDCEFPNDVIGKSFTYWKSRQDNKLILSIQTRESGYGAIDGFLFDMRNHTFFGSRRDTPLMAPLGMMDRIFLESLGGIDRRFICGQYENHIVMMAKQVGSTVEIFGGPDCFIDIDHLGKSILAGESKTERDFLKRPFAIGYSADRSFLESAWVKNGVISKELICSFEKYEDKDICKITQSNTISELWR